MHLFIVLIIRNNNYLAVGGTYINIFFYKILLHVPLHGV